MLYRIVTVIPPAIGSKLAFRLRLSLGLKLLGSRVLVFLHEARSWAQIQILFQRNILRRCCRDP